MDFDLDKLMIIFFNLIFNVIKFMLVGGEIMVEIRQEGMVLLLVVFDIGIGILVVDFVFVFDCFFCVVFFLDEGGLGIGFLFIKELVELLGGEISVKSQEGEGSIFVV